MSLCLLECLLIYLLIEKCIVDVCICMDGYFNVRFVLSKLFYLVKVCIQVCYQFKFDYVLEYFIVVNDLGSYLIKEVV